MNRSPVPTRRGWTALAAAAFLSLALMSSCSNSNSGTAATPIIDIGDNDPAVILASGDSVTYGVDSSGNRGYRTDLARLMAGQDRPVTIINGGRSGARSGDASLVLRDMARYNPAVVVLQYGINDALVPVPTTPPGVVNNLRSMVYGVLHNQSIAVLTTLTPTCGYRVAQNDTITLINEGIREMAVEFEDEPAFVLADVANAFAESDPTMGGCTLIANGNYNHPNNAGYALMAQVIFNGLEPLAW